MNLFMWLLFGVFVGLISNLLDPYPSRGGAIGAILLGVGGALIGGFLSTLIFDSRLSNFSFTSFAVSILGALLILYIGRVLRRTV